MCRCDLRQAGEVGIAQYKTNVGMSDQPSLAIDDIGVPALADLQRGNHIPDQLQIDLGDGDPGIAAGSGHRHRHIRLGFLAKMHRTKPDAVLLRLDKGR